MAIERKMRTNNVILYTRIQTRYKELYNEKKLRYEVCIEMLGKEFYKANGTIAHILRMDLPPLETVQKSPSPKGETL